MKIEELEKRRDEIIGFNKDIANQLNAINEEFKTIQSFSKFCCPSHGSADYRKRKGVQPKNGYRNVHSRGCTRIKL